MQLNERVQHMEALLAKLVENIPSSKGNVALNNDVIAATPLSISVNDPGPQHPPLSGNNECSVSTGNSSTSQRCFAEEPILWRSSSKKSTSTKVRTEGLQRRLAVLVPTQAQVNQLQECSYGWWLIQQHMLPYMLQSSQSGGEQLLDVASIMNGSVTMLARLLLCMAICIQQLPVATIQELQLDMPLTEFKERVLTLISQEVTSDDDLVANLDGVECLVLQGLYHTNAGSIRKAWVTFRRAFTIAQLMGLSDILDTINMDLNNTTQSRSYYLWYQILQGVRKKHFLFH